MEKIREDILTKVIKKRRSNSHKGNFGRVLLIGGNKKFGGAIIMAAEGALNAGAGLVTVASDEANLTALHTRDPEIMFLNWNDELTLGQMIAKADVIVCGMGLGEDQQAQKILKLIKKQLTNKQTILYDASALDLIAKYNDLLALQAQTIILTPHQMEWERLSKIKIPDQTNINTQEILRKMFPSRNVILVLKSNHTQVYYQDKIYKNYLGNPGMATGGMGDTLAGIIGSFCGQFETSIDTVAAAVYLHSLAGDEIYKNNYLVRPTKLSASLPRLMKLHQQKS
ncbi:NAD(P)H-hydrate dehydratase [Lactobacillus sp. PV037]|uniref:NAD(P)H-hydrate dehydratase n=1 Tax=unclassified Lactobacillus TaxID=2620435 RepID=UPI002240AEED|nr:MULTISPECIES: NAD(P)H-hydrate dehydratase [unclassified Lactobacillus]QNQ81947.1 NAD(P)H-hydrate dehydratase [Lactobacillus sp. PV012]QNQ84019.1 NAD(P)H-hydrate dehydratase [Lactobacillus sp. PV037]